MDSKIKILVFIVVLSSGLFSNKVFAQSSWQGSYLVIANNIGTSKLSSEYVGNTFKGKYSLWSNGESVTIVLPSSKSPQASDFASKVMGMSISGMQKYWLSLVFQGRANPPVFLESTADIIQYISKTSGAIALVPVNTQDIPSYLIIKIQN